MQDRVNPLVPSVRYVGHKSSEVSFFVCIRLCTEHNLETHASFSFLSYSQA